METDKRISHYKYKVGQENMKIVFVKLHGVKKKKKVPWPFFF